MKKAFTCVLLGAVVLLSFIGCSSKTKSQPASITISAAASLTDAMEEIKNLFKEENSSITITLNFGSSGALRQQIEQGAPVDIFMSAAANHMDTLQKNGLIIDETRKDLLLNNVVLISPVNNTDVSDFSDITTEKVKKFAIGEPESVPAGKYGKEVLDKLGIWDRITDKTVLAKDVRQVLNYVETENVEAGIVYQTDAMISKKVKIIAAAPADSHTPIVYPLAIIKDSKNQESGKEFIKFLSNNKTKAVFEKYGFTILEETK